MSRPESPLKNNLSDEETIKKLKGMLIKEKRINKENSKIISDLNNNIEAKTKENELLISQIQRLSENIGSLEDDESKNTEAIMFYKKEISNLNIILEELNLSVEDKKKAISNFNKHLKLIYEKLQLPAVDYNENQADEIISLLENKNKEHLENLKIRNTVEDENLKLKENIFYLNQYENKFISLSQQHSKLMSEINDFKVSLSQNLNEIIDTNKFLSTKVSLNENEELNIFGNEIISNFKNILLVINIQIESNELLKDGFDKIVSKCNELESIIRDQNEKITSLQNLNKKSFELESELQQKDVQIKRLEELIEANRNISRALETDRDQLQNDLVDLRQRHEEKEGYLMEEYREAKQNLENFRIINEKESSYKIIEMERLQKIIDQYQNEVNDCRSCLEFEILLEKLKNRFGISGDDLSHEETLEKVIDIFENLQNLNEQKICEFQTNNDVYGKYLAAFQQRLKLIESKLKERYEMDEKFQELELKNADLLAQIEEYNLEIKIYKEKFDKIEQNIRDYNEMEKHDIKTSRNVEMEGFQENSCLVDEKLAKELNKTEDLIIDIEKPVATVEEYYSIIETAQEKMQVDNVNIENSDKISKNIEETSVKYVNNRDKSDLVMLAGERKQSTHDCINIQMRKSEELRMNLEKEIKMSSQIIHDIESLFVIEHSDDKSSIIDHVKRSLNHNEYLTKQVEEYKSKIDEISEDRELVVEKLKELQMISENDRERQNNFDKIKEDHEKTMEKVRELQLINEALMKQIDEYRVEIENHEEQWKLKNLSNKTNESCLEKFEKLESINENLSKEIVNYKLEIDKIREDRENVTEQLKNLQLSNENLLKQCENELENQNDTEKRKIMDKLSENHEAALEKVNKLQIANEKLTQQIEKYKLEIVNHEERLILINKIKEDHDILFKNMKELEETNENLSKQIEKYKGEISKLSENHENMSELINELQLTNINLLKQCEGYKSEIENHAEKIQNLQSEIELLNEKLSSKEKTFSGNDLMSLEMAEFDKTLINLNNQLLVKSSQIEDLETALKSKDQLLCSFREQLSSRDNHNSFLEERGNKMKQLLVKTKRELADSRNELEQLKIRNQADSEQIELLIHQLEENKFLLGEALTEKEKLIERHSIVAKKLETISKNRDLKLMDLRSQLDESLNDNRLLQREFETYKIKAQNALSNQQRPKSTFSNFMNTDSSDLQNFEDTDKKELKKIIIDLEKVIKDLKIEVQEGEDKIFSLNNDLDNLKLENEKWIDKYKLLVKENSDLNLKFQKIFQESQEMDKNQKHSYSNLIDKFEMEKENIKKTFLNQIEDIKLNHSSEICSFEKKLAESENEKFKYQEEIWDYREQLKSSQQKLNQISLPTDNLHTNSITKYQSWPTNFKNPSEYERQQGEGMENTSELDDAESLTNQYFSPGLTMKTRSYNNTLIPLDKLINDPNDKKEVEEQLITAMSQMQSYRKKMDDFSEMLHDSESTVARLTEQATILKSEIRRLEKNNERNLKLTDESTHEYLKNVIIKFLDYETKSDERIQLVPVLVTLLTLDLVEKEKLTEFTKVIQFNKRQNSDGGWSNYFNWSGMS